MKRQHSWEQAFHVYAAIYSQANPSHATEIWQYMHVINIAAGSYSWENVSFYDYTFRQLMSQKPKHSWAKTYTQGWNLAMTIPCQSLATKLQGQVMAAAKAIVSVTGWMIAVGSSIGTSVTGERTALGTIGVLIVAVGIIVLQIAKKGRKRKGGIQGQGHHKRGPQSERKTITEKISSLR